MAKTSIFNPRKRARLLRNRIPVTENLSTVVILGALAGVVVWVALQRTHYNPEDRDVAIELLRDPAAPKLYSLPLKTWAEPGVLATTETPSLGPFPASIMDQEWSPASRLKQFGPDNLYEKINGEAEKFLKQGFKALNYIVLKSSDDGSEIAIELYDQGDIGGSMGVFSEHLSSDNNIEQQGQVVYFKTSAGVIGRNGRFFFRVAGDSVSEKIGLKSSQLIAAFSQLEASVQEAQSDAPEEARILSATLNIAPELITYQRENVFQYDFVEDFWFGQFSQGDPEKVFIHRSQSQEEAEQLFADILEEQSYDYEIVDQGDRQAVMRHGYLQNYFAIGYQGPFIFGVENAPDGDSIVSLLQKFNEALAGG